jgi:hypothetical protein
MNALTSGNAQTVPARSLVDTVPAGQHRQIAPTMAGAHLAAVTNPQHIALAVAAECGLVLRGGGPDEASVATLKSLARKGLLRLTMKPNTRYDVDFGVITPAGRRELDRLNTAAANTERLAKRLNQLAA